MRHDVVEKIRKFGVEVKHFPAGRTCYCQPDDVVFNKLFKSFIFAFGIIGLLNLGKKKLQSSHNHKKNWQNGLFVQMVLFLIP